KTPREGREKISTRRFHGAARPGRCLALGLDLARATSDGRTSLRFGWPSELVVIVDHRLEFLGVAFDGQHDCPFLGAIATRRDRGDNLPGIGQAETNRERSVGAEMNRFALQGHMGIRFGGAVNDQLGIDLEVEIPPWEWRRCSTAPGHRTYSGATGSRCRCETPGAAPEHRCTSC